MLYKRRKILLGLIEAYGGKINKIELQKLLFLLRMEEDVTDFDFVPYKYGCYSFFAGSELRTLIKYDYLESKPKSWVLKKNENILQKLPFDINYKIKAIVNKYRNYNTNGLLRKIYLEYPFYATRSVIAENVLKNEELESVNKIRNINNNEILFSIGYEGITIDTYLKKLTENNIKLLIDVRKNPVSMKRGFSKNELKKYVELIGVRYIHIPELGIDGNKRKELNSKEDYIKLFDDYKENTLPSRKNYLDFIYSQIKEHKRVVLTCFENDHTFCHRNKVVEALLENPKWNQQVTHL